MLRRVRLRAQEIEAATVKLTQELRRSPTETEIAGEVGLRIGQYHDFLDQYSRTQVALLEACLEFDGQPRIEHGALVEDTAAVDPQSQRTSKTSVLNSPAP